MGSYFVAVVGPLTERIREPLRSAVPSCEVRTYESPASALEASRSAERWPYCEAVILTDTDATTAVFGAYRAKWPDVACFLYAPEPAYGADQATLIYEFVPDETAPSTLAERVAYAVDNRTHTAYPLPRDERRRLRTVETLDIESLVNHTELQNVLDRLLTETDTPMGGIGIITDHAERFVVTSGPVDTGEVDRQETICTYTILGDDVYAVEDVLDDPVHATGRYATSELRSYLGRAVRSSDGLPIGAVCVFDTHPRSFTANQSQFVLRAADETERILRTNGR